MKYLEDSRLTQLTSDLTGAVLNTRGSGNGSACISSSVGLVRNAGRGGGGNNIKCGKGKKPQRQASGGGPGGGRPGSPASKQRAAAAGGGNASSMPAFYAYNSVGYSTYNSSHNGGGASGPSSSCRAIYGRVEAYTTKRAGSDKKTAFAVGERYAHEMEKLNEAVEALKRRHALEHEKGRDGGDGGGSGSSGGDKDGGTKKKNADRRGRSCSVDGSSADCVTFATSFAPPRLLSLEEGAVAIAETSRNGKGVPPIAKRDRPLEGILKRPSSSSKRCRATSFDISTGPSVVAGSVQSRLHHRVESSNGADASFPPPSAFYPGDYPGGTIDDDTNTHPLIPQPSLYRSSLSEHHPNGDMAVGRTMVPRRLMTDLILTLNASFPDYDFGDAQVSDFCTLSTADAMRRINERLGEFAATTDEGYDFLPRFWNTLDDILFDGLRDCEVYSYAPKGSSGDDPLEFLTMSMANENGGAGGVAAAGDAIVDGRLALGPRGQTVMFNPIGGGGAIASGDIILNDGRDTSMLDHIPPAGIVESPPHVTLWSMNYLFVSHNRKRIVLFACVQTMRTPQGNDDDDSEAEYGEYAENDIVFDEARREEEKRDVSTSNGMEKSGKSTPIGDESVSVMVDDTDFEEGSVDVDGDVDRGEYDFDTGTMGISIGVPSQIA